MIRLLSFLVFLLFIPVAQAQEADKASEKQPIEIPKGDFSELKHTKSNRIDKVIDALTLLLKDGTIVRLTAIDIPDFHIWEDAPYSDAALQLLKETLPELTEVMLYQTRDTRKGRTNRMGHEIAQVTTKKDGTWIQGALLANGLARVHTTPQHTEMLEQLYKTEDTARKANIGIWAKDSPHLVITPEQATERIGDYVVVEGTVQKVSSVRNSIYLNFGQNWKTDFTIQVTPDLRRQFSKEGVNIMSLSNTPIRVRGNLREYNGPLIELEDIAHLEIIKTESPE